MPKPNLIITAAEKNCGDFVINHWLASLQENVDLKNIDVVVLDYGLRKDQREKLEAKLVTCYPCQNGPERIVWSRFREIARFLKENPHDQVLAIDGSDVIFQADISHLFSQHKTSWRAVCEANVELFQIFDIIMKGSDFGEKEYNTIVSYLSGRPMINSGFILGPADKFESIWPFFQKWSRSMNEHGGDQLLINYLLYRNGFVRLDSKYNMCIVTAKRSSFSVKNGTFYDRHGEVIPVVHNAGRAQTVNNFGYGASHNQLNRLQHIKMQLWFALQISKKKLRLV